MSLAGLTEEARKLALDRFRLIQPHLEQSQSLQSVARAAGIPYRTAQRWVAQYRHFGLAALVHKKREDRGERRAVSAKVKEIIEGLALQKPPLPIAALYRQVLRFSKELGEKQMDRTPSGKLTTRPSTFSWSVQTANQQSLG